MVKTSTKGIVIVSDPELRLAVVQLCALGLAAFVPTKYNSDIQHADADADVRVRICGITETFSVETVSIRNTVGADVVVTLRHLDDSIEPDRRIVVGLKGDDKPRVLKSYVCG
ncbi:MAG TPA: hypothetical protein VFQ70_03460 [Candidatus Saccharimonadaceae bacterium]|nr:hypothetical protein [Candidatus Saccharimonadaceae bacterium]